MRASGVNGVSPARLGVGDSLCLGLIVLVLAGCGRPTVVEVINVRDAAVSGLELRVTGNRYPIETLSPGAVMTVRLEPTGESGISLLDSASGDTLGSCCYIEPGSGGRMQFTLEADSVRMDSRDSGRVGSIP